MKMILSLMLCSLVALFAGYALAADSGEEITVTGTIRLVGNEPFPELIITTDKNESYSITGTKREELLPKQGQKLTLTGIKGKGSGGYAPYSIEVDKYQTPDSNTDSPLVVWLKRLFLWR